MAWDFISSVIWVVEKGNAVELDELLELFKAAQSLSKPVKLSIILVNMIKNKGMIAPFPIAASVPITIKIISILLT